MVQNATARVRPRSMQFDKSPVAPDTNTRRAASRDTATRPPAAGTRTSSLPLNGAKQYVYTPIRHHRSMLDVERPPKLPVAKPLSYGELYPNPPELIVEKTRPPFDSQAPRVSSTGSPNIANQTSLNITEDANLPCLRSCKRYSHQFPISYHGGLDAPCQAFVVWIGGFTPSSI
jgi:septin 7